MKTTIAILLLAVGTASAQPLPPNFQPFVRTNAASIKDVASAWAWLQILATNQTALAASGIDTSVLSTNGGALQFNKPGVQAFVQSNALPILNVKAFGALGDDSHDDTAAIQAALTYWATSGINAQVFVPAGRYKVTGTISIPSNVGVEGGNVTASTNSLRFYGEGEQTIIDARGVSSGNVIQFLSTDGQTNLYNAYLGHMTIYGTNWGGGASSVGVINTGINMTAIFLGLPGVNNGTVGVSGIVLDDLKVMWCNRALVVSNAVGVAVNNCTFQNNAACDALFAHVDSGVINNNGKCWGSVIGNPFQSNHFSIIITGTGEATGGSEADSGNGFVINNLECDGQAIFADGTRGLLLNGGDLEEPSGYGKDIILLTNRCYADFYGVHINPNTTVAPFPNIFHLVNGSYNNGQVHIANCTVEYIGGKQNRTYVIDDDSGVLSLPSIYQVTGAAGATENFNEIGLINGVFNTNTWLNVCDAKEQVLRKGYPIQVGANFDSSASGQGFLTTSNTEKSFTFWMPSYAIGSPQDSAPALAKHDLAMMGGDATSGNNDLYLGTGLNPAWSAKGATRVLFATASSVSAVPSVVGYFDAAGKLNANGAGVTNVEGTNILSHLASGANATSGWVPTANGSGGVSWAAQGGGGGGATNLTPWTSDINAAQYSLTNAASVGATNITADTLTVGTLSLTNSGLSSVAGPVLTTNGSGQVQMSYNGLALTNYAATNLVGRAYHPTNMLAATSTGFTLNAAMLTSRFVTNNNCAISGIADLITGIRWQGMCSVSNSAASTIWITNTPSSGLIGAVSTNALAIAAGKQGYFSFDCIPGVFTNACNVTTQ